MKKTPKYKCRYCDRIFNSKSNCVRHIKTVHKRNLKGEPILNTVSDKFSCALCKKNFAVKRNLKLHLNAVHFSLENGSCKKFKCSLCTFETLYPCNLRRHISRNHKISDSSAEASLPHNFKCPHCTAIFLTERSLTIHKKKLHSLGTNNFVTNRKCPLCPYTSLGIKPYDIHNHFDKQHDIPVRKKHYVFDSIEDFHAWKCDMERESTTSYVKTTSLNRDNGTYAHYKCRRCGFHKSNSRGIRLAKLAGSCKIGGYCPANITMKVENNKVHVVHIFTHVGHKNEAKHLRRACQERRSKAPQLANAKPHEEDLKEISGSMSNFELRRINLANKKDIVNIENDFNLLIESVKDQFDPIRVASWVNEFSTSEDIAFLSYKPQGIDSSEFPELKEDDFLLIFITKAQQAQLVEYGNEIVYVDRTYGTNSNDLQLFTLLTIDETREGFPSSFMFTNRADIAVMNIFFESVRLTVGVLKPKVFMTDMDETFFSSWKQVMGLPENRIFCTWDVLKAWKKKLLQLIKIKEQRMYVLKLLVTLIHELNIGTFSKILEEFMQTLSSNIELHSFFEYFLSNFVADERYRCWAYCYRVHVGVNTNMSLENFNKVLKFCHLKGKKVRRLNKTLCAILSMLKDRIFDLLINMSKENLIRKLQILRRHHGRSLTIGNEKITAFEDEWQVVSSTQTEIYSVKRIKSCNTCHLKCLYCNSCFHEYVCTCMENAIKNNMCKHIHAVARTVYHIQKEHDYTEYASTDPNSIIEIVIDQADFSTEISMSVENNSTFEKEKSILLENLQALTSRITNVEQVQYVLREVTRMTTAVDAMSVPSTST